jgi:hypothetical protein
VPHAFFVGFDSEVDDASDDAAEDSELPDFDFFAEPDDELPEE